MKYIGHHLLKNFVVFRNVSPAWIKRKLKQLKNVLGFDARNSKIQKINDPLTGLKQLQPLRSLNSSKFYIYIDNNNYTYIFKNATHDTLDSLACNSSAKIFQTPANGPHQDSLLIEQSDSIYIQIYMIENNILTKRIFSPGPDGNELAWFSVSGKAIPDENLINYNRIARHELLKDKELEIICKDFGCHFPGSRDFIENFKESFLMDFGKSKYDKECQLDEKLWSRAFSIPPAWSMSKDEWDRHFEEEAQADRLRLEQQDKLDTKYWREFKSFFIKNIRAHHAKTKHIIINEEAGSVRLKKLKSESVWAFNLPDNAWVFSAYESRLKSFLFAPTRVTVTLLAIDHNDNAYVRIHYGNTKKDASFSFKIASNGAPQLPMYRGFDLERKIYKPFDFNPQDY